LLQVGGGRSAAPGSPLQGWCAGEWRLHCPIVIRWVVAEAGWWYRRRGGPQPAPEHHGSCSSAGCQFFSYLNQAHADRKFLCCCHLHGPLQCCAHCWPGSSTSYTHPGFLPCPAGIAHSALQQGLLQGHLTGTIRPALERQCAALCDALARHLQPQGCAFHRPQGGYFVWLQLPQQVGTNAGGQYKEDVGSAGLWLFRSQRYALQQWLTHSSCSTARMNRFRMDTCCATRTCTNKTYCRQGLLHVPPCV
jgi:hypothetical protein